MFKFNKKRKCTFYFEKSWKPTSISPYTKEVITDSYIIKILNDISKELNIEIVFINLSDTGKNKVIIKCDKGNCFNAIQKFTRTLGDYIYDFKAEW